MDGTTVIRTPYEEMHRSFILRLMQLKDGNGRLTELGEFLRQFACIRSSVQEVLMLEAPCENVIRIRVKRNPLIHLEDDKQNKIELEDWIIDFLFSDSMICVGYTLDFLSAHVKPESGAKHALLHFGCSPDSFSGDFVRNIPFDKYSPYDVFKSISPFEMSLFLDRGQRFEDRFYEVYAEVISSHAKRKAIATWQKSAEAFSFLCEKVIADRLKKNLGEDLIVKHSSLSQTEATVCFTLPRYAWNLFKESEQVDTIYGLTLRLRFISGQPFVHLSLSHRGPLKASKLGEEPMSKEYYQKAFLGQFDLREAKFHWAETVESPLDDEFAYSYHPIWIYDPRIDESPETSVDLPPEEQCKRLTDQIYETIENIKKCQIGI